MRIVYARGIQCASHRGWKCEWLLSHVNWSPCQPRYGVKATLSFSSPPVAQDRLGYFGPGIPSRQARFFLKSGSRVEESVPLPSNPGDRQFGTWPRPSNVQHARAFFGLQKTDEFSKEEVRRERELAERAHFAGIVKEAENLLKSKQLKAVQLQVGASPAQFFVALRKAELCIETGLPLRDLRAIDSSFHNQLPTILARQKAIVVNLAHVKAIVTAGKVLIFNPDSLRVKKFLIPKLQQKLNHEQEAWRDKGGMMEGSSLEQTASDVLHHLPLQQEKQSADLSHIRVWREAEDPWRDEGYRQEDRAEKENWAGEHPPGCYEKESLMNDITSHNTQPPKCEWGIDGFQDEMREVQKESTGSGEHSGEHSGEPVEGVLVNKAGPISVEETGEGAGEDAGGLGARENAGEEERKPLHPEEGDRLTGHRGLEVDSEVPLPQDEGQTFELKMLEVMLEEVDRSLRAKFTTIVPEILQVLKMYVRDDEGAGVLIEDQRRFLKAKNRLLRFGNAVNQISSALKDLLSNDEDMAEMNLTRKALLGHPLRSTDHSEVEELVENYYKRIEEVGNEVETLLSTVDATSEYLRTVLDSSRNKLIRIDVLMNMATCSLAAGGSVAAIFGMNLISRLEDHPYAFMVVGSGVGISSALMFISLYMFARRRKIL